MSLNNLFPDEGPDRRLYPTPRLRRPEDAVRWHLTVQPLHRRRAARRALGTRLAQRFAGKLWNELSNHSERDSLALREMNSRKSSEVIEGGHVLK
jgi:hypothetical protein